MAASEGIKVVLTGAVEARGSGYTLTVRAIDPANGNELGKAEARPPTRARCSKGIGSVASKLRDDLGDTTPESVRRAEGETVTTASLEALQSYSTCPGPVVGRQAEEAIEHYRNAIRLDENFGRAYSGLATILFNIGRRPEAEELWKQALAHMDRMTERERYRTLGLWFNGAGASYEQAIENFEKLVALYPADRAGQANLAFSYFQMLDFKKAMEHGRCRWSSTRRTRGRT